MVPNAIAPKREANHKTGVAWTFAAVCQLAACRNGEDRQHDDEDLEAEQAGVLRYEDQCGRVEDENEADEGLGGPGGQEPVTLQDPVEVDGNGDEQQSGQCRGAHHGLEEVLPACGAVAVHGWSVRLGVQALGSKRAR